MAKTIQPDPDLQQDPGGGQIDLVHANIPDHAYPGIRRGWPKYYWRPWKAYLRRRPGARRDT